MFTLKLQAMPFVHANSTGLSSLCVANVFVPKVKSGKWADEPKVQHGECKELSPIQTSLINSLLPQKKNMNRAYLILLILH